MVRTRHFHCHGPGSIPGRGTKIPQVLEHSQKKKGGGQPEVGGVVPETDVETDQALQVPPTCHVPTWQPPGKARSS